jgi:hypothetical protein
MDEVAPKKRAGWLVWLLAVVGFLAAFALIALVTFFLTSSPKPELVQLADKTGKPAFVLGGVEKLAGTDLVQLRVSMSHGKKGPYSYSEDEIRNIVLLNTASGESWKILPDNGRRIDQIAFLPNRGISAPAPVDSEDQAPWARTEVYVLTIDRPGNDRRKDVLVGDLATRKQAFVMRSIDGIEHMWMQNASQIGMIVREKQKLTYRVLDVPALRVISSTSIDID